MSLFDGNIGISYIVQNINLEPEVTRRLEALGINEGTVIEVLNRKKNGAMIIRVRGVRLAMGKAITKGVIVERNDCNG